VAKGEDPPASQQHLLLATDTGALSMLCPLSETEYRRLSSLTAQLATSLPHVAGLNPRGYRMAAASRSGTPPGVDAAVGRSIVDGTLLPRWSELGSGRRHEVAGRVGFAGPAEVRAELEGLLGWVKMEYF